MDSPHAQLSAAELLDELLASDREITDFLDQLAHLAAVELTDELPVLVGITLERNKRTTIAGSSRRPERDQVARLHGSHPQDRAAQRAGRSAGPRWDGAGGDELLHHRPERLR